MNLRLGTRGSDLAMAQSRSVAAALHAAGHEVELVVVRTSGDQNRDVPFAEVGEPGIFVRELESALLRGDVDLAVHSYKDLPSVMPDALAVAAVPAREDPADVLLVRAERSGEAGGLAGLASGAIVGTASARRQAWIRQVRPDVQVEMLRGNVPTRLSRLRDGGYDAILLAAAGLDRLLAVGVLDAGSFTGIQRQRLAPTEFVPAPTQGAIAVQVETARTDVVAAVATIDDPDLAPAIRAERALQARVEAGCQVAFGAYAQRSGDGALELIAALELDGGVRACTGQGQDPLELAGRLADDLLGVGR